MLKKFFNSLKGIKEDESINEEILKEDLIKEELIKDETAKENPEEIQSEEEQINIQNEILKEQLDKFKEKNKELYPDSEILEAEQDTFTLIEDADAFSQIQTEISDQNEKDDSSNITCDENQTDGSSHISADQNQTDQSLEITAHTSEIVSEVKEIYISVDDTRTDTSIIDYSAGLEDEVKLQYVSEQDQYNTQNDKRDQKKGPGLFARLKQGLEKTTQNITGRLDELFKGHIEIDDDLYEEIEEILITGDVGFETTMKIIENLKMNIKKKSIQNTDGVRDELKNVIEELLTMENQQLSVDNPPVILVIIGVNGVGKTTSIGKLALRLKNEGKSVLLAAADTFRAAAAEQLEVWAQRADVDIIKHQEGSDPSAVIFDAIKSAKSRKTDVLICDTAGRLHNKKNLMQELSKIFRIIDREYPEAFKEVLIVIDATTGQNAISQVKLFKEAAPVTGVILTKLDGTAKGGVVLSIVSEQQLPIKLIGVGEKIEDLQDFNPKDFAEALFSKQD